MIREVLPNELLERQVHFMEQLERAATFSNGLFTAKTVFDAIVDRRAMLFETAGGIAVIDSWSQSTGPLVRIAALAGDNISQWIAEVDEVAFAIAKEIGAKGVTSVCPPEWEADVIRRGYSISHIAGFREIPRVPIPDVGEDDVVTPAGGETGNGARCYRAGIGKSLH